jgi:phosphoribosylglycinamide formyltransferase 2
MRGDRQRVIVEEFIHFEFEITLLTVRQRNGSTVFCQPIGHVQERGDYQYSWQPQPMKPQYLKAAEQMAEKVTSDLGGAGLFGVEFFVTKDEVIFSELSPRPHDTGLATKEGTSPTFTGVAEAMSEPGTDVRIFGKPTTRPYRRMAVALAKGPNALERARAAAKKISVITH